MTPAALRREAARRVRGEVRAARARAQAAVDANPALAKARRRRRGRRTATVAALLLLLLFLRCEGPGAPAPPAEAPTAPAVTPPRPTAVKPPVTRRPLVTSRRVERPAFEPPARPQAPWLDDFRLQVAARSPRLSRCFVGAERPGALRWTTLVSTGTGAVGSHEFEPLGPTGGLSEPQRACLEAALSSPPYGLARAPGEGLPQRVSLVLEF
ncbi:MAG: hypothetical protein INH41_06265 [Myxococcaceae bacterium]|nr:hypothetical protein [Myxococcaceae bacterium]MCA3011992.1 hypothetical protein [Myxococcaceae bacterium]